MHICNVQEQNKGSAPPHERKNIKRCMFVTIPFQHLSEMPIPYRLLPARSSRQAVVPLSLLRLFLHNPCINNLCHFRESILGCVL